MLIETDRETGQESARHVCARSLRLLSHGLWQKNTCPGHTRSLSLQGWNHRETGSQLNKKGLIHALALAFLWMDFQSLHN